MNPLSDLETGSVAFNITDSLSFLFGRIFNNFKNILSAVPNIVWIMIGVIVLLIVVLSLLKELNVI